MKISWSDVKEGKIQLWRTNIFNGSFDTTINPVLTEEQRLAKGRREDMQRFFNDGSQTKNQICGHV
jgi:hypothetical protein